MIRVSDKENLKMKEVMKMTRMTLTEWKIVLNNLKEENQDVEILWLDDTDEWILCHDCEIFEDGFATENQAYEYLNYIKKKVDLEK